jgi:hypothetical protein
MHRGMRFVCALCNRSITRIIECARFALQLPGNGTQEARERKPGRPREVTVEDLRAVARVYNLAVKMGERPTKAVAEAFILSDASAAKRVFMTRQKGFLPKTTRRGLCTSLVVRSRDRSQLCRGVCARSGVGPRWDRFASPSRTQGTRSNPSS